MSRPIIGKVYVVQPGDSLSSIAAVAYGDENQWEIIHNANQNSLKSNDPNLIFPGEELIIPERPGLKQIKDDLIKSSHGDDLLEIQVDGRIIPIVSATIIRTMNTASDAWSATIAWEPGKDEFIDNVTRPFGYPDAKAYINKERMVTGTLFDVEQLLDNEGSRKNLIGYSSTINIVDSNLRPDNYEDNNVSLKQRAEKLLKPYGLRVVIDDSVKEKANEVFDRVAASDTDTIFSHLAKLAVQKKMIISSTEKGNLLLTSANIKSKPVGTIEEGSATGSMAYKAKFDGRKRFSVWRVSCQTPDKDEKKIGISKDNKVPLARFKNVTVNNDSEASIKETSEWIRSKDFTKAMAIPFPFPSFFAPNGELWRENTLVTVKSKTIGVPNGFNFLIQQVKYKTDTEGEGVILSLIPPEVYTGEVIEEPWSEF